MPVCEECETTVDEFSLLSTKVPLKGPLVDVQEAQTLIGGLETRLFQQYNELSRQVKLEFRRFEHLVRTIGGDSKDGNQLHILDTYHFLGMRREYERIFPKVLLNSVLANKVKLKTSIWSLVGEFPINPFQKHTDAEYQRILLNENLIGPHAASLRENPPKDLVNTIQEICTIMREISESHLQNWEENYNTNHLATLAYLREAEFNNIRDVREFCPACGSLEWQGIHVDVKLTIQDPEVGVGTDHPNFEYSGRITELTQQFLPDIIRAAQRILDQFKKRNEAFEKFNKGIEKKVKRRIKKREDAKKKAEIKALKAKLKELEDSEEE